MKQIDPFSNTSYKFGFGFFETMRAIYGRIIFFDEHIERLNTSLKKFNLNEVDKEIIHQNILNEIKKKKSKDARIRITYSLQNDNPIITYEVQKFEHTFPDCAKISFSKIKLIHGDELRQHKTTNYFLNYYEFVKAKQSGFDEVIFLDNFGHILEGTRTNIFLVFYNKKSNKPKILTPTLKCGVLPGIARNKVFDIGKSLGIEIKTAKISKEFFFEAQEIFLTNSLYGVIPAYTSKLKSKHEFTFLIKNEFNKFFEIS